MKETVSLESVWNLAQSLSDANKRWLADRLYEEVVEQRQESATHYPCQYTADELEQRLSQSVQSYRDGQYCTSDELRKRHPLCE